MLEAISTTDAPEAIGPYSQALFYDKKILFISGQLPIDPEKNEFVSGDEAKQAEQCMKNIGSILKEVAGDYSNLVKITIFTTNIKMMASINSVYASFFGHDHSPARAVVEVSSLPKNAKVEIEGIACF